MTKTAPRLGAIDLNLLVVFDAILRDRSVSVVFRSSANCARAAHAAGDAMVSQQPLERDNAPPLEVGRASLPHWRDVRARVHQAHRICIGLCHQG
ncbi:MAG: hypothetical protein JWR80_4828 [Bradyrhizobium sp.]|nr:hypothetical protein [Bradyrhizobium sp.]